MNDVKLKPCPFCGGEPSEQFGFSIHPNVKGRIICACGAQIRQGRNDTEDDIRAAWNKRAQTYDQGFDNGVKAILQQLDGLIHDCCTVEEIEAWIDRQWEEEVVA